MSLPFRPLRWLKSPHLQTIGATVPIFSPPRSHVVDDVEDLRIAIASGASAASRAGCTATLLGERAWFLHAQAWWARGPSDRAPAIVIVHGIGGSKDSHCCMRAAVAFHRAGYHTIRVDMRGAGESIVDAPSLYHAGLTDDLDRVVRHLAADPRVSGVLVLGFSGGGAQALKLAGQWGQSPPEGVIAIASVSAPLDYTPVAAHMDSLVSLPYRFHVLRGLLDRARAFAVHHPRRAHYRIADLAAIKRFRDYDGRIIVPMHGFDDVDEYYREAGGGRLLGDIHVPTLIVHAEDDPMVKIDTVRPWLDQASREVTVRLTREGGHLGWLEGIDESSWVKGWATRQALAFFAEHAPAPFRRDSIIAKA